MDIGLSYVQDSWRLPEASALVLQRVQGCVQQPACDKHVVFHLEQEYMAVVAGKPPIP